MNKASLHSLILAAEFTAIIAILSQFTVPLGVVPLTGQAFTIDLTAAVSGKRARICATLIYFLLELIGLPVYAGMPSGFGVLFGPTGDYSIGFISSGLLIGYISGKTTLNYIQAIIANVVGTLVTLVFGMIWLKHSVNLPWLNVSAGGFAPFIIPGIIKAVAAAYVGILIRQCSMKCFLAHPS